MDGVGICCSLSPYFYCFYICLDSPYINILPNELSNNFINLFNLLLDISEHGLASAYADFLPAAPSYAGESEGSVDLTDVKPAQLSVGAKSEGRYTKISIICPEERFGVLRDTMNAIGVMGMTVSQVMGCGAEKGKTGRYRGVDTTMNLYKKIQVDIVVSTVEPGLVVAAARKALNTEHYGDGKIFVTDVEDVMRVRTGEMGYDALAYKDN